jgi:hypothetical protein
MNIHSQDIDLIRSHLDVVKDVFKNGPLSLKQEGALQRIEADLVDDDSLSGNIERVKVHFEIVRKYPLSDRQRQAVDLALEVVEKILLSAHRG